MDGKLHFFTSAAVNYLPKVRTLCRSLRRHHPEAVIHLALADERPEWLDLKDEPFDSVLDVSQLGIDDWHRWAFTHNIVELSTAIKPFAMKHLMSLPGCETVLYFDPDIVVFSRVDDILATLRTSNIALTPHQNKPEQTLEAVIDNEIGSLRWGIFNLGFIGVANTAESRRFAQWWSERTYHFCRAEVESGLFTDQKWINHVPVFFDGVSIVKSSRHNVATWNLTTRVMTGDLDTGLLVDSEPLGFYHFTGFDSGAHRIMAVKNAGDNSAVRRLIAWYERETAADKDDPVTRTPWAFGRFSNGEPIRDVHRWIYRTRIDLREVFPDPFDASPGKLTLYSWCETSGRALYPERFSSGMTPRPGEPAMRAGVSFTTAMRLFALFLSPTSGRSLRARVARVLRSEGLGGVARRLRGYRGAP
ncbi:MAG TPA: glycosyl transferase [Usitatibacter sp.]